MKTNFKNRLKSNVKSFLSKQALKKLPPALYCFTYHRVGSFDSTPYDSNVFSCDEYVFEEHLNFFQDNFTIITIDMLNILLKSNQPLSRRYALITFDDGYIDNYSNAFRVLKRYSIPATFYVPVNYIDSPTLPWWDEIAWMIKHTNKNSIKLNGWDANVEININNINHSVKCVLNKVKRNSSSSISKTLHQMSILLDIKLKENANHDLFMNWKMLREMKENNMDICSHGCSHQILSHLSIVDQEKEVLDSKQIIDDELSQTTTSFAYPVGASDSFTDITKGLLKQHDYLSGFSYMSGINRTLAENRYSLRRLPVSGNCTVQELAWQICNAKIY